jgi:hypothetical protein
LKLYNKCLRCGHPLKDPKSKERGFGKVCFEKQKSKGKELFSERKENGTKSKIN